MEDSNAHVFRAGRRVGFARRPREMGCPEATYIEARGGDHPRPRLACASLRERACDRLSKCCLAALRNTGVVLHFD